MVVPRQAWFENGSMFNKSLECNEDVLDIDNVSSFIDDTIIQGLLDYTERAHCPTAEQDEDGPQFLPSLLFTDPDDDHTVPGTLHLDNSSLWPELDRHNFKEEDPLCGNTTAKLSGNEIKVQHSHDQCLDEQELISSRSALLCQLSEDCQLQEVPLWKEADDHETKDDILSCSFHEENSSQYNADVSENGDSSGSCYLWPEQEDLSSPVSETKDEATVPDVTTSDGDIFDSTPSISSASASPSTAHTEKETSALPHSTVLCGPLSSLQDPDNTSGSSPYLPLQYHHTSQPPSSPLAPQSPEYYIFESDSRDSLDSFTLERDQDSCTAVSFSDQLVPSDPSIEE